MKFGVHAGLWMKAWQDDPLPILDIDQAMAYPQQATLKLGPDVQ